jgi:hypothetical protein
MIVSKKIKGKQSLRYFPKTTQGDFERQRIRPAGSSQYSLECCHAASRNEMNT